MAPKSLFSFFDYKSGCIHNEFSKLTPFWKGLSKSYQILLDSRIRHYSKWRILKF
jgi:hypothetical protein